MVPIKPGVVELYLLGERAADRDRRLRLVWDAVVTVLQPQAVPVNGRLDVAVVGHLHCDLRPLIDVQCRTGDRSVVGEHAQHSGVEALADGRDAPVESIARGEPAPGGP